MVMTAARDRQNPICDLCTRSKVIDIPSMINDYISQGGNCLYHDSLTGGAHSLELGFELPNHFYKHFYLELFLHEKYSQD